MQWQRLENGNLRFINNLMIPVSIVQRTQGNWVFWIAGTKYAVPAIDSEHSLEGIQSYILKILKVRMYRMIDSF